MKNHPVGAELFHADRRSRGQIDGHDEATSRFSQFCERWAQRSEELNDLYCSSNIILVVKSRRMRWAGHVASMEERRFIPRFDGEIWGKETTWKTQA